MSVISSACSPVSGWDTNKSLTLTPSFSAYTGSRACSASTNAAVPPLACAEAIMARVSVVLPEDSGPNISITRPRGMPPTPSAMSRPNEPVGIESTSYVAPASPKRMTEPLPNCFSIWLNAAARAFLRFSSMGSPQQSVALLFHIQRRTLISYEWKLRRFLWRRLLIQWWPGIDYCIDRVRTAGVGAHQTE